MTDHDSSYSTWLDTWTEANAEQDPEKYSQTVMSVGASSVVQNAVFQAVEALPEGSHVLVHGSGQDDIIPSLIAACPNVASVLCVDVPPAVELAEDLVKKSETAQAEWRSKISYEGMDAALLGETHSEQFDAVISINSLVASSQEGNQALLNAAYAATKPGGKFIGLVPTIEYSMHVLEHDLKEEPWKRFVFGSVVDKKNQIVKTQAVGPQHFPDGQNLRTMSAKAGFNVLSLSSLPLDDPAALVLQKRAYNQPIEVGPFNVAGFKVGPFLIADFTDVAFSPVHENLLIAEKPGFPAP